ncbi:hypothetical protein QVD99_003367 [Batrachochytrium dendrobatidis]|nr:hypothetical protein QVD99_003367 [Batrachochytrium dendrobatidis]
MENKAFFVRYLTNQSVKVETHYIGEQDRQRPLTDVADLVAAYKPGSLLADTPTELLTLHYVVDGPAIPGNTLLIDIQHSVGSPETIPVFEPTGAPDTALEMPCPVPFLDLIMNGCS